MSTQQKIPRLKKNDSVQLTPVQLRLLMNARERGFSDPTDRDDLRQYFNWRKEKQALISNALIQFNGEITAAGIEALTKGSYKESISTAPITVNLDPVTYFKLQELVDFLGSPFTSSGIRFAINEAHRTYIGERSELYGSEKQQHG